MIGALILGIVAGAAARYLVPRDFLQGRRGLMSFVYTIVLGLAGAFVGWLLFTKGLGIGDDDIFDLGGLLGAIVGAVIILGIGTLVLRVANKKV